MSFYLLAPSGVPLPLPSTAEAALRDADAADDGKDRVWMTLGRGTHGIPNTELLVSRKAAELMLKPADHPTAHPTLHIRVLGRNPLFMQHSGDGSSQAHVPVAIAPGTEVEWPAGATLYLLHAAERKCHYPFTLCTAEAADPGTLSLSLFDPEATQDATGTSPQKVRSLRPEHSQEMRVKVELASPPKVRAPVRAESSEQRHAEHAAVDIALAATASELPITASQLLSDLHNEQHEEEARHDAAAAAAFTAAESSTAAVEPAVAFPCAAEEAVEQIAAAPADVMDDAFQLEDVDTAQFSVREDIYAAAASAASGAIGGEAASSAASSDEPDTKRPRSTPPPPPHVVMIKRSLEHLASTPAVVPPVTFLSGHAVYIVPEGISARQIEILVSNVRRRGGVVLDELPKHRFHTATTAVSAPVEKEKGSKRKRGQVSPSLPPRVTAAAEGPLQVVLIMSPSIRTRGALQDVLAREQRRAATAEHAQIAHHLGVPRTVARAASPPASPKHGSSPVGPPSGSSQGSASSGIRLRSTWQLHHLEWLVESFKRGAMLAPDQFCLDDHEPSKGVAAASRKLDYLQATSNSATTQTAATPASKSATDAEVTDAPSEDEFAHEDTDHDDTSVPGEPASATAIAQWNRAIAAQLCETSEKYTAQRGEHFRAIAFRRAAGVVSSLTYALRDAETIRGMEGIGPSTLGEITAILRTGHSARLEALQRDPVLQVHQLLQTVHGIGPRTAEKMYAQGIRTIDDLRKTKLTSQQATYLKYYDELRSPIPRAEVSAFERAILSILHSVNPQLQLVVCGSYRRGKATCGDIDCMITHPDPEWVFAGHDPDARDARAPTKTPTARLLEEVMRRLHAAGILTDDLVTPSHRTKYTSTRVLFESGRDNEMYCGIGRLPDTSVFGGTGSGLHRRIDLKVYHCSEFPFAVLYFTGSAQFNRAMRLHCNKRFNLSLSDKALAPYVKRGKEKVATGEPIPCRTERDIFDAIHAAYVPPTERNVIPSAFLATVGSKA